MLAFLSTIPEWLGAGICAAIGWFGHIAYLSWQEHKTPYEQDKDRFDKIIKSIDPYSVEEFLIIDVGYFSAQHCEFLMMASSQIDLIDKFEKSCLDRDLKVKERALVSALNKVIQFISWKSFYRTNSTTSRTFLWDSYDPSNAAHQKKADKIKSEFEPLTRELLVAYRNYKAYGDKKFAKKIAS